MNRQSQANSNASRSLNRTAAYLSQKENARNRPIVTVLFALFAALVLSACAVESPFQGTGSVTVLPNEPGPMIVSPGNSGMQIASRQQLAEYQANLPAAVGPSALSRSLTASSGSQIRNRQQLADYQATLPLYTGKARPAVTIVQQISDRQALAEYQATLR